MSAFSHFSTKSQIYWRHQKSRVSKQLKTALHSGGKKKSRKAKENFTLMETNLVSDACLMPIAFHFSENEVRGMNSWCQNILACFKNCEGCQVMWAKLKVWRDLSVKGDWKYTRSLWRQQRSRYLFLIPLCLHFTIYSGICSYVIKSSSCFRVPPRTFNSLGN